LPHIALYANLYLLRLLHLAVLGSLCMNSAGSTPYDFAQSSGSSETVVLLEQLALHCATVKVKVRMKILEIGA